MKNRKPIEPFKFKLGIKWLIFICIFSYLGIYEYDGKWDLPLLAWQLIGFFAGSVWVKIISGTVIFCWIFLCVLLLRNGAIPNSMLVIVLCCLCTSAVFYSYDQVKIYSTHTYTNVGLLSCLLPATIFLISSAILLGKLKRPISVE